MPNVKIIDSSIIGKYLKKCKIVIVVHGFDLIFEASILGMQTIQLGNLGTIRMLPNVHPINDIKKIKKIEELIKNPVNKEENHKLMLDIFTQHLQKVKKMTYKREPFQ